MAQNPYVKQADEAAGRYGIPTWLYRNLIGAESNWNPSARNPSGATGLVQIHLPSHPDITPAQAQDPAFALDWGARYLRSMYDRFGDWELALAAYNAGPGNVANGRWKSFGETTSYVKKIMGGNGAAPPAANGGLPSAAPSPAGSIDLSDVAPILQRGRELLGMGVSPILGDLLATPVAPTAGAPPVPMGKAPKAGKPLKVPKGSTVKFLQNFVAPFGVTVTDVDTPGVHTSTSWHYQQRAIDVGGDPARMAAVAHEALKHPGSFREMFYTGPGAPPFFIKDGRVYPISQLKASVRDGHTDHVHLAS
jgi:hypothetical protein